jgi:hypothetical protein
MSNLNTEVQAREPLRQKLQAGYEEFLRSGRTVHQCAVGESAQYRPMTPEEYAAMRREVEARAARMRQHAQKHKTKKRQEYGPDLRGQTFGMLTPMARDIDSGGRKAWLCRCDCGLETMPIITTYLLKGVRTHCGCLGGYNRAKRNA